MVIINQTISNVLSLLSQKNILTKYNKIDIITIILFIT